MYDPLGLDDRTLAHESCRLTTWAMESGQLSAAVSAIKGKAVLTGHWVEKAEIGSPGEFDHLTDEDHDPPAGSGAAPASCCSTDSRAQVDLENAIRDRLVALGYISETRLTATKRRQS